MDPEDPSEAHLRQAEAHVRTAERLVQRQERLVERLQLDGVDTSAALELLQEMRAARAEFYRDLWRKAQDLDEGPRWVRAASAPGAPVEARPGGAAASEEARGDAGDGHADDGASPLP